MWSLSVCVALPIDSRLVDMTNYLVHKTYTQATHALSQTSENIYFYLKKISRLILFSQQRVKWKLKIEPINYWTEARSAHQHRSILFCACRKNIRWLANWSLMARRLKFTFDFPAVNESLWLGRRLCLVAAWAFIYFVTSTCFSIYTPFPFPSPLLYADSIVCVKDWDLRYF